MGLMTKGYIASVIKYCLINFILAAILIIAISVKYQISFSFVLHGSDARIEQELAEYLSLEKVASDIFAFFPLSEQILDNVPIIGDIYTLIDSANTATNNIDNLQASLFGKLASPLLLLIGYVYFSLLSFIYALIKKVTDKFAGGTLCGLISDILAILQIIYIGSVSLILFSDYFLNYLLKGNAIIVFCIIVVIGILASIFKTIYKNRRTPSEIVKKLGSDVLNVFMGLLNIALIYLIVICIALAMNSNAEASIRAFCIVLAIIAIILTIICFCKIVKNKLKELLEGVLSPL